ncbi:MAG: TetR/AcrR family transcriptional regulator [Burkholderiaceae bacterium]
MNAHSIPASPVDRVQTAPRSRLLAGMAAVIGRQGYVATTIADIVAEAGVSKRTFYEHFASKADCLIALYEAVNLEGLEVLRACIAPGRPWREQVERALTAYFGWMSRNPRLVRSLFIDVLALGQPGLAVRRRVHEQIACFMIAVVQSSPDLPQPASPDLVAALVGGIHELVLVRTEQGDGLRAAELAEVGTELVCRVLCSRSDI